jgi:small subunit ribosomal protein S21
MSDYGDDFFKRGLTVRVKNNDVNKALKKLKKLMQQEGIFQELRKREYYEQPSLRRKREQAQAVKRWQKKQAELRKFD